MTQGRVLAAFIHFCLAGLFWLVALGWLVHIVSCVDAAMYKPKG